MRYSIINSALITGGLPGIREIGAVDFESVTSANSIIPAFTNVILAYGLLDCKPRLATCPSKLQNSAVMYIKLSARKF